MKETVLITGANGMIAAHTAKALQEQQYEIRFLTREPSRSNEFKWDVANRYIDEKALEGVSYIIHLAGSKLNDGTPLTDERKKLVWNTRVGASMLLLDTIKAKNIRLKAFISASALGYYSFSDNTRAIDESGNQGRDFSAFLSAGWEKAADLFKSEGLAERVVKLRVCLVLGKESSLFRSFRKQLLAYPPGFRHSRGATYSPWVHADDIGRMFAYAVTNSQLNGVFNTTAPEVTSQQVIFKLMYYLYEKDLASFQATDVSYNGKYLTSAKIAKAGFVFKYPDIKSALTDLMTD